jgi:hypothetical protein
MKYVTDWLSADCDTERLRRTLMLIMWGRLVTCGGLLIRLQEFRIHDWADCQSVAGCQPAPQNKHEIVAMRKQKFSSVRVVEGWFTASRQDEAFDW